MLRRGDGGTRLGLERVSIRCQPALSEFYLGIRVLVVDFTVLFGVYAMYYFFYFNLHFHIYVFPPLEIHPLPKNSMSRTLSKLLTCRITLLLARGESAVQFPAIEWQRVLQMSDMRQWCHWSIGAERERTYVLNMDIQRHHSSKEGHMRP